MTRYLWTRESEYCICGHHLTDHETLQWPISLTENPVVICRGGNKTRIRNCHCDKFRPYRTRIAREDEEEVIENKIRMEVIQE